MNAFTNPFVDLRRIEITVTHRCTGRCLHCQVGAFINAPGPSHVPGVLAAQAIRTAARHYPLTSIMTFGGEPLLYAEDTAAVHAAATACGIATRQLITNGYFTRDIGRAKQVARMLKDTGTNDVLLSVDCFHQERIPLERVRAFAEALLGAGLAQVRLQPAWVVDAAHDNIYNARTYALLDQLADLHLGLAGNDIFMAGNAAKNLAGYYPPPRLDPAGRCGGMPYADPLDHVRSISIEPDGAVAVCGFVLGNLHAADIATMLAAYDPTRQPAMAAILDGGTQGLLDYAASAGIAVDTARCYGICDVCHAVTGALYPR